MKVKDTVIQGPSFVEPVQGRRSGAQEPCPLEVTSPMSADSEPGLPRSQDRVLVRKGLASSYRDSLSTCSTACMSDNGDSCEMSRSDSLQCLGESSSKGDESEAASFLPEQTKETLPPTASSSEPSAVVLDSLSGGSSSGQSSPLTPRYDEDAGGECLSDVSPYLASHYHSYSAEDLHLHVSIAQGGLQRIRREAQSAQVSLKDIVEMFGNSIANMAAEGDAELARCGWQCPKPIRAFEGSVIPKISVGDYLWRIVRALNAHSDPALFASDGSDLSRLAQATSFENLDQASASSDKLDQMQQRTGEEDSNEAMASKVPPLEGENSAMGRGLRCLLLAFVYIDRVCTRFPQAFRITRLSVHRTILAAIYLATKFTDDTLPKAHWTFAKLGGVSCRELMVLEEWFCRLVGFRFYVTESEFQAHCMEQLRCAVRSVRHLKEMKTSSKPVT